MPLQKPIHIHFQRRILYSIQVILAVLLNFSCIFCDEHKIGLILTKQENRPRLPKSERWYKPNCLVLLAAFDVAWKAPNK